MSRVSSTRYLCVIGSPGRSALREGKTLGGGRGMSLCATSPGDKRGRPGLQARRGRGTQSERPLCSPRADAPPPAARRRPGAGPPSPPPLPTPSAPAPPGARAHTRKREPGQHANEPAPAPRLQLPTAQWTTPAQTRCLQLCLGRKKNLWPYFLLFPGAAEAGHQGEPPPPIGLSSPPSLESGAAPPNPCRRPR